MKRNLRFTFFTLLFVSLFTIFSFGQETTGSLQGTVRDANGAVIPNAIVTASNQQRTFTETTNGAGEYTFAALPADVYIVEVKATGFQIDGETGSENVWVVDGLEVTRTFGGSLGSTKNVPLEFVREVQVKSAGYEAEFGGALGGVINVTSRPGGNMLHGTVSTEFESSDFRAGDRLSRRYDRANLAANRRVIEYYKNPNNKDDFTTIAPRFSLNGPIWKDKAWFSVGMAPDYTTTRRQIYLINPFTATTVAPTVRDSRIVETRTRNDYMFGRVDAAPLKNLSAYFSWFNSPTKTTGAFPAGTTNQGSYEWPINTCPGGTCAPGQAPTTNLSFADPRLSLKGGFVPANAFSTQATYNPLSDLIVTFRFGRNYLNDKGGSYDVNLGAPLVQIVSPCGAPIVGCPANTVAAGTLINGSGGTLFDITTRKYFSLDATYLHRLFGQQHTFKGGFQRTQIANKVSAASSSPLGNVAINFNQSDPQTGMRGVYGYYTVSEVGTSG